MLYIYIYIYITLQLLLGPGISIQTFLRRNDCSIIIRNNHSL